MRTVLLLSVLTACATPLANAAPAPSTNTSFENAAMLSPIQVDSLTLTPLVAATPPTRGVDFIVLDEGMANDAVVITEAPSESVNNLVIINRSDRDLFILAGEVIIGGKQDRIIGRNTVIPGKTRQTVPVFCVEHGRWDNSSKKFRSANALAHGRLRGQASYSNQQEVWNEVAIKNELRQTTSSTDTYRKIATQQSDGTLATQHEKLAAALARIPRADRARMIGYVVAINGNVATVDMFGSPGLFRKLEGKLVKSYITEAVDVTPVANVAPPSAKAIQVFMSDADSVSEEKSYETTKSKTSVQRGSNANQSNVYVGPENTNVYKNYQAR